MYELIIIGAGPAGLTAALYAGRYRLKTLLLEKMCPGGQIILSPAIENFPGFPAGIATQELIDRLEQQVRELDIAIETTEAAGITLGLDTSFYEIKTQDKVYQAKSIIVAAGAQPKPLGIKGEAGLIGRGVSYCGTCDGPLYRNKEIAVVGAGDRAIEEAIFLSGYAKAVTLIHRRDNLRASKILQDKINRNPKVKFILDTAVEEAIGENKLEAIKLKNIKTNIVSTLSCQGLFIFVGVKPNTAFLNKQLKMDEAGFIITNEEMETSQRGVFACGDCRKKSLYQVITACSEGAVAAASAQKYLI